MLPYNIISSFLLVFPGVTTFFRLSEIVVAGTPYTTQFIRSVKMPSASGVLYIINHSWYIQLTCTIKDWYGHHVLAIRVKLWNITPWNCWRHLHSTGPEQQQVLQKSAISLIDMSGYMPMGVYTGSGISNYISITLCDRRVDLLVVSLPSASIDCKMVCRFWHRPSYHITIHQN